MQITLEGHPEPVPAQAGDTVLASLLRAKLAFPFQVWDDTVIRPFSIR